MFTKTTLFHKPGEGGGSGGDQHNLGWYATPEALRTAHATATAGDWAIVGSTDTVWIWDTDTNAWKDSDQKGQVTSVNGQTGTVVLTASDVGAATAAQGALADTAIQSVKTINGQSIVGTGDVTVGGLPDQTGQSGKFLTTDGTDASWSNKPLVNTYTGTYNAIGILGTVGSVSMGAIAIGNGAQSNAVYSSVAIGPNARVFSNASYGTAIGGGAKAQQPGCTALGASSVASATCAIQIGAKSNGGGHLNTDANTFKVGNDNGNFEMMSADGTIPAARHAALPSADGTYVLKLVIANGVPTLSWVAE